MCRAQCVLMIALSFKLVHSWDIALSIGDRIEFYTEDGNKIDTVRFNSQNLYALVYDEVHNMLLYIEKQSENDAICGYNMTSVEYKCFIERNGRNIQGLAFDPVTETLFFTDTKERSINSFSLKSGSTNNVYGNLLVKMDEGIPTDIVVDSCRGYVYWTNTNLTTSTIERARLNGSDREVIFNATYKLDLHSLAIDQQTKKIFWLMPETKSSARIYNSDLIGNNLKPLEMFTYSTCCLKSSTRPNTMTVSKKKLWRVDWCSACNEGYIRNFLLEGPSFFTSQSFKVYNASFIGISAKYRMKEQYQGISDCSHIPTDYEINDSFKVAKEYKKGPFCVHGIEVTGQSHCKSSPRYIGERCDVSICENYCFQGNCSITEEELPECRCYAGYSGERCEVNVCNGYCLNNGICSLNEEDDPMCECVGAYEGQRCDVPLCLDNGEGSPNEVAKPACQCVGIHGSASGTDDTNKTTTTSTYQIIEGNVKVSVVVEVKPNN